MKRYSHTHEFLSPYQILLFPTSAIFPFSPDHLKLEHDLIRLNTLNEPVIYYNLQQRFAEDIIYVRAVSQHFSPPRLLLAQ
jgi:hypothetical protein